MLRESSTCAFDWPGELEVRCAPISTQGRPHPRRNLGQPPCVAQAQYAWRVESQEFGLLYKRSYIRTFVPAGTGRNSVPK